VPAMFRLLLERGRIEIDEMFRAFNMGIGLILVTEAAERERACAMLTEHGEAPIILGSVEAGGPAVRYVHLQ